MSKGGDLIDLYAELFKRGEYEKVPIARNPRRKNSFFYLSKKQLKALNLLTKTDVTHVGYGGSARSGKTVLEAFWQILSCFAYPETRWALGRKELKRLKTTTLTTYYNLFDLWGVKKDKHFSFSDKYSTFKFKNNSELVLIDMINKPTDLLFTRFGGYELTGAAVDESNESTTRAITTLFSRCGWKENERYGLKKKMLETFNPDKGHIYQRYWKPFRDKSETESKKFIYALPTDNPHPAVKQWIKDVIKDGDKVLIERVINGNFDYDDDPSKLISYDKLTDVFNNTHVSGVNRYISADIAMQGRDNFVAMVWEGLKVIKMIVREKTTGKENEEIIVSLKNQYSVPNSNIIVDSDGIGSYLSSYIPNIKTFQANRRAKKMRIFDKINDEVGYKLAELINNTQIYIEKNEYEDLIIEEIDISLRRDNLFKDIQKKKLVSKEYVKEQLGRSPDFYDTLKMRMYFEICNKNTYL